MCTSVYCQSGQTRTETCTHLLHNDRPQIETKGAKAWGAITIGVIAAANVWALYLLVALVFSQCGRHTAAPLSKRQEFMTSLLFTYAWRHCTLCHMPVGRVVYYLSIAPVAHQPPLYHRFGVLLCSVALYVGLAVGLDHEISKNFSGQHVFARPDWACGAALLGGACLGGVTMFNAGGLQFHMIVQFHIISLDIVCEDARCNNMFVVLVLGRVILHTFFFPGAMQYQEHYYSPLVM